jgi:hypothetical protein
MNGRSQNFCNLTNMMHRVCLAPRSPKKTVWQCSIQCGRMPSKRLIRERKLGGHVMDLHDQAKRKFSMKHMPTAWTKLVRVYFTQLRLPRTSQYMERTCQMRLLRHHHQSKGSTYTPIGHFRIGGCNTKSVPRFSRERLSRYFRQCKVTLSPPAYEKNMQMQY